MKKAPERSFSSSSLLFLKPFFLSFSNRILTGFIRSWKSFPTTYHCHRCYHYTWEWDEPSLDDERGDACRKTNTSIQLNHLLFVIYLHLLLPFPNFIIIIIIFALICFVLFIKSWGIPFLIFTHRKEFEVGWQFRSMVWLFSTFYSLNCLNQGWFVSFLFFAFPWLEVKQ